MKFFKYNILSDIEEGLEGPLTSKDAIDFLRPVLVEVLNNGKLSVDYDSKNLFEKFQNFLDEVAENINDESILNILLNKLNDGVRVSIIVPESKKIESNSEILNKLELGGALISHLKKPYQHAKVLIIDNRVMYVGSVNFSRQSMEENREVGVITINKNNIDKVIRTFEKDFKIR